MLKMTAILFKLIFDSLCNKYINNIRVNGTKAERLVHNRQFKEPKKTTAFLSLLLESPSNNAKDVTMRQICPHIIPPEVFPVALPFKAPIDRASSEISYTVPTLKIS